MASKLRRAPLFGIDSGFSIVAPCKAKSKSVGVGVVGVAPFHVMECEVSSTQPASYNNGNGKASPPTAITTTSTTATAVSNTTTATPTKNGSQKSQLHVDFMNGEGEVKEKREKYLTAKYGSHQMSLIRKRLAVEMWLYDELQKLYEDEDGASSNHDVEIDLDEVLDMDGDEERKKFLLPLLSQAKKSQDVVNKFVEEVIAKAKTL